MCELLLAHGAEVDAVTSGGRATPLHRAAVAGREAAALLLLQHGASPEQQDADAENALHKVRRARSGRWAAAAALGPLRPTVLCRPVRALVRDVSCECVRVCVRVCVCRPVTPIMRLSYPCPGCARRARGAA